MQQKPYQWLAWCGSIGIIFSAILASFDVYPLDLYTFLISSVIWVIVSIIWQEKSLIAVNVGVSIIYVVGIINTWLS